MNETVKTAAPPAHTTLSSRPNAYFGLSAFYSTALAATTGTASYFSAPVASPAVSPSFLFSVLAWASSLDWQRATPLVMAVIANATPAILAAQPNPLS